MIPAFQPLYHGFFHNGLDIGRTEQFTADGIGFCHPELSVLWNVPLPGQIFGSLKQFLKGSRLKPAHLQQNPVRRPQKQVGVSHCLRVTGKSDSSVLHLQNLISQIQDLSF